MVEIKIMNNKVAVTSVGCNEDNATFFIDAIVGKRTARLSSNVQDLTLTADAYCKRDYGDGSVDSIAIIDFTVTLYKTIMSIPKMNQELARQSLKTMYQCDENEIDRIMELFLLYDSARSRNEQV